jgi:formylglycine-generating enzyme required for sulfatase activity
VSWTDCQVFLKKLSTKVEKGQFRLPTEAEWEYACRAGTMTSFYTGDTDDDLDEAGWFDDNSMEQTYEVGLKKPNAWGLYDMHGNVCEWCQDWYGEYSHEPEIDPIGPSSGSVRVLRGGAWKYDLSGCRSASRSACDPTARGSFIGMRVVFTDH